MPSSIVGIDLRDHKRNSRVHTPGIRLIDVKRASSGDGRCIESGLAIANSGQHEVEAIEHTGLWLAAFDNVLLAPEQDACSLAALRGEQAQAPDGKVWPIALL